MGQIIQMQCQKCGFKKDFFIGGGLRDCELETILAALPDDGQHMLETAVSQGAIRVSITRKLCVCDACKTTYVLPIINYTLNDEKQVLYGICTHCGEPGGSGTEENAVYYCPHCGTETKLLQMGHWD